MQMARLGGGRTETERWYRLSSLDAARDKDDGGDGGWRSGDGEVTTD